MAVLRTVLVVLACAAPSAALRLQAGLDPKEVSQEATSPPWYMVRDEATNRPWNEREDLNETGRAELQAWFSKTKELFEAHVLPRPRGPPMKRPSTSRYMANQFVVEAGNFLGAREGLKCGETGDGHFLRDSHTRQCKEIMSFDAWDKAADVKLNLNIPLSQGPPDVQKAAGSLDLVMSMYVFEHISHPAIGVANLNQVLKPGGTLTFAVPFGIPDHSSPQDHFRYTVRAVADLLRCSGFEVKKLEGVGSPLTMIAYLAGVPTSQLSEADLQVKCDGLTTNYCADGFYMFVGAVATKTRAVAYDEVQRCFA